MIDVSALLQQAQANGSRDALETAVDAVRQIRAWCDAQEIRILQELESHTFGAPETIAAAGRMTQRDGDLIAKRARTVEQIPALATALDAGQISGRHVDAAGNMLRSLETGLRNAFCARVAGLVGVAGTSTADEWARRLRREARALRTDGGMARLEQQRRNTRLRTWVDTETGMWHLTGAFDPVTGTHLDQLLRAAVTRLFTDGIPDTAPEDLIQRQHHLRALALVDLLTNRTTAGGGRGQASIAIDLRQLDADGKPLVDVGIPVDIPFPVVRDLLDDADITPVIIQDGAIVWAPGNLNLGRKDRLANKAQRRALRARYPRCVVAGCDVHYLNTKLHHLIWWENGGLTDLINLAPVCSKHHAQIHNGELELTRNTDWTFTTSYRTQRPPGTTTAA